MMFRNSNRAGFVALAIIGSLAFACIEKANAQAWNTNTVSFTAPTTCTSGQPIANCQPTGYRVERSSTIAGSYAAVGTTPASPFTHLSAAAGQNCYRVIALSAQGDSSPSVVTAAACKTNVEPSGPPNPPTNTVVVATTAYNVKPDLQHFAFVRGARAGTVRLGAACDESRITNDGYTVISRNSRITPRPAQGAVLVARCG